MTFFELLKTYLVYPEKQFLICYASSTYMGIILFQAFRGLYIEPKEKYSYKPTQIVPIFKGQELQRSIRAVFYLYEWIFIFMNVAMT